MEEKSIILELFNEGIIFTERIYPKNREYYSKVSMAEKQMEKLKKQLSDEQLEMLEDFLEIQNCQDAIYNEETFRMGVSLGVRLTAEAFILGE